MRLLIALILIMLSFAGGAPAIAHPLDASCLAQSKSSPVDCEALHDEGATKDQQRAALEELAQQQGKFPRAKANLQASSATIALNYFQLGFVHIIPKGLDHILFVLALFLGAKTWRQLLAQVSAFTFAHSVTLALAALGLIEVSPSIVEPLIALSIVALALENIFVKEAQPWRMLVVFGFGLFHGLGFAGILSELGFDQGDFLLLLIAFNLGVEGGQFAVLAAAALPALLLSRLLSREHVPHLYNNILVRPASMVIALIGFWWAFERIFLA